MGQCSCIALASAIEWILQKRPNRVPDLLRVGFSESPVRTEEFRLADNLRQTKTANHVHVDSSIRDVSPPVVIAILDDSIGLYYRRSE